MMTMEEIAEYAFMAFVAVAVIAGLAVGYMAYDARAHDPAGWNATSVKDANAYVTLIMLILGVIIGIVSITAKEVRPFLIASIALMVTRVGVDVWEPLSTIHGLLSYWATGILNYIVAFVAPAAVIISIRSVWALAQKK